MSHPTRRCSRCRTESQDRNFVGSLCVECYDAINAEEVEFVGFEERCPFCGKYFPEDENETCATCDQQQFEEEEE